MIVTCTSKMRDLIVWTMINMIIVYLILVVVIALQVNMASDLPKTYMSIDPDDINTGDILGVGYRNPFGWFVTSWSYSVWSHTGIAWRDPITNELLILEAADYGGKYVGVFRIPFSVWLKINRKSYLCINKYTGNPIDSTLMDSEFTKLQGISLDTYNYEWYRFLLTRPYVDEPNKKHYTCYEVTIKLLQQMGIVQKKYTCSSYFTSDIVNGVIQYEPGASYTKPIGLIPGYDIPQ